MLIKKSTASYIKIWSEYRACMQEIDLTVLNFFLTILLTGAHKDEHTKSTFAAPPPCARFV